MRSMKWQLGMLGTVSTFAFGHRETMKTCVEVAVRRTFRIQTSSQQSCILMHDRYWLYRDQEGGRILIDVFTERCCCGCRNNAPLLIANKHARC